MSKNKGFFPPQILFLMLKNKGKGWDAPVGPPVLVAGGLGALDSHKPRDLGVTCDAGTQSSSQAWNILKHLPNQCQSGPTDSSFA